MTNDVRVRLDSGGGEVFSDVVNNQGAPPDKGGLAFITKDKQGGGAVVCVTFRTVIDGKDQRVQTVTTLSALRAALVSIDASYDPRGRRR